MIISAECRRPTIDECIDFALRFPEFASLDAPTQRLVDAVRRRRAAVAALFEGSPRQTTLFGCDQHPTPTNKLLPDEWVAEYGGPT